MPAEVKAALLKRAGGDRCEVPGCKNRVFLHYAHGEVPNAAGGGQEVWNTYRLCADHHTDYDCGLLVLRGWTRNGRPVFANEEGDVFLPDRHGKPCRKVPRGAYFRLHPDAPARRGRSPPAA